MAADPVVLVDLTDEELAALEAPGEGLVVTPYLDELGPGQRDTAVVTAFRGLVARGMVDGPSREQAEQAARTAARAGGGTAAVDVRMSEVLSQVLTLRRVAPRVVCAQRTVADLRHWRYVHVLDDELALDEVVEPTGLHRFALLRSTDVSEVLLSWLVPEGCESLDGPAQSLDPQDAARGRVPDQLLERLAQAQVVGDVTVRRVGDGGGSTLLGTFAAPGMLVLSRTGSEYGSSVVLRAASRRTVQEALIEQLEMS